MSDNAYRLELQEKDTGYVHVSGSAAESARLKSQGYTELDKNAVNPVSHPERNKAEDKPDLVEKAPDSDAPISFAATNKLQGSKPGGGK